MTYNNNNISLNAQISKFVLASKMNNILRLSMDVNAKFERLKKFKLKLKKYIL